VKSEGHNLEFIVSFTCLGSVVSHAGSTNKDIINKHSKSKTTFARLMQVCKSAQNNTEKSSVDLLEL